MPRRIEPATRRCRRTAVPSSSSGASSSGTRQRSRWSRRRSPAEPTEVSRVATCVVVAFHKPALLEQLLKQLADPRLEVIVVNVEDDPAVSVLSGARILPVSANIGYAAGVNLGAAHASADAVVFMNDDVSLDAPSVLMLVARLRS